MQRLLETARTKSIASRTTYTNFDSLNGYADSHYRWDEPGTPLTHDERMTMGLHRRGGGLLDGYLEGQVWGPRTLADAAAIYVRKEELASMESDLRDVADQYGLNIYEYSAVSAEPTRAGILSASVVCALPGARRQRGRATTARRRDSLGCGAREI